MIVSLSIVCTAGVREGKTSVSASGESLYDVSMPELARVLLPQFVPKPPKFEKRTPEWLTKQRAAWLEGQKQWLHCLLSPTACQQQPSKPVADAVVQHGNVQDWQVIA